MISVDTWFDRELNKLFHQLCGLEKKQNSRLLKGFCRSLVRVWRTFHFIKEGLQDLSTNVFSSVLSLLSMTVRLSSVRLDPINTIGLVAFEIFVGFGGCTSVSELLSKYGGVC